MYDSQIVKEFLEMLNPDYSLSTYGYACPFCDTNYKYHEIEIKGNMNDIVNLYQLPHEIDCDFSKAYNALLRLEENLSKSE